MTVTHVVRIDAGLYWGGGEIQAERTAEALAGIGVDVRRFQPLDRELGDLVHFFGPFSYYEEIAHHLRERGVPYVVSPIFVTHRSPGRLRQRAMRQKLLGGYERDASAFLRGARELYTLTKQEEENLVSYYGSGLPRMIRVPNGVEERFASGDPSEARQTLGMDGRFALHIGTIEPDKNQLGTIRAAGSDVPLVILGRVNAAAYLEQCRREASPNVVFLDPVPHDSPLLASLMAAAHVFCLPSRRELFPLSALEATVAGCRLVLADRWGSREIWGEDAHYVDTDNPDQLRKALVEEMAMDRPSPSERTSFLSRYSWTGVARQLAERYREVASCQS